MLVAACVRRPEDVLKVVRRSLESNNATERTEAIQRFVVEDVHLFLALVLEITFVTIPAIVHCLLILSLQVLCPMEE